MLIASPTAFYSHILIPPYVLDSSCSNGQHGNLASWSERLSGTFRLPFSCSSKGSLWAILFWKASPSVHILFWGMLACHSSQVTVNVSPDPLSIHVDASHRLQMGSRTACSWRVASECRDTCRISMAPWVSFEPHSPFWDHPDSLGVALSHPTMVTWWPFSPVSGTQKLRRGIIQTETILSTDGHIQPNRAKPAFPEGKESVKGPRTPCLSQDIR